MQSFLPENPLQNPKQGQSPTNLEAWVLDEAIAAYTGTGPSLQAALDVYKRNVSLAVSSTALLPPVAAPRLSPFLPPPQCYVTVRRRCRAHILHCQEVRCCCSAVRNA